MAVVISSANAFCRQPFSLFKPTNPHLQQRFIAHKSQVIIPSSSSTNSLCFTTNKSAQKVVKSSQKSQTATETNEKNTEINVANEEEKPKTGDSENIVKTVDEVNKLDTEAYSNGDVELSSDENKLKNSSSGDPKKQFFRWDEWKDRYRQSQKDFRTWGFGKAPIFLVYDNGEGDLKVFINEKEIHNRFGSLPFMGDEARDLLDEKLAQAHNVARDIERGEFKPPRHSSVYEFSGPSKSDLEQRGLVGSYVFSGVSSVIAYAPPVHRVSVVGYYVLSCSLFLWVTWKFILNNGSEEEDKRQGNDFALDLESKRRAEKEGLKGKLWFEKIALQIQHLARQVLSFLGQIFQNIRVWIKEAQSGMKHLAMGINSHELKKSLAMKPISTDGLGYKKTILRIQATAKQSHVMEQNGSQVFSQQDDTNYSKSKTMGGNADRRRDEDQPSNSSPT